MTNDVWVLGATGRMGESIAGELVDRGITPVLVGRSREKLDAASRVTGSRTVIASSPAEMAAAIRRQRPAVVVNTVGPFRLTADALADATLPAGHYVDLANDLPTILAHRRRDAAARRAGHTIVTGAGFGVAATESLLTWIVADRPRPTRVRVDMIPSIASAAGRVGEALAGSLLDGVPDAPGGRRFQARVIADGKLASAHLAGSPATLRTPDGDVVTTGLMPLGELLAAQRASDASAIESASSEAPSGVPRLVLRGALPLMYLAPLRHRAIRLLARLRIPESAAPRRHSWAHALVEWSDGTTREGWLSLRDANDVTASVAAEVASRLATGSGMPGAYTPAELFGTELAKSCGGEYFLVGDNS